MRVKRKRAAPRRLLRGVPDAVVQLRAVRPDRWVDLPGDVVRDARGSCEGVGSSLTSVFHFQLHSVLDVLGVPRADGWLFSSCVTFGYPTGRGRSPRRPVHEVSFRDPVGNQSRGLDSRPALVAGRDVAQRSVNRAHLTEQRVGERVTPRVRDDRLHTRERGIEDP